MSYDESYYSSQLYTIQEKINQACNTRPKIFIHASETALMKAGTAFHKSPEALRRSKVKTGIAERGCDGQFNQVLVCDLFELFENVATGGLLKRFWPDFSAFIVDTCAAIRSYKTSSVECEVTVAKSTSEATSTLAVADARPVRTEYLNLNTNYSSIVEEIHDVDREFLYSRLRRDSNKNLYWVFGPHDIRLIPLSDGTVARKICDDDDFWTSFFLQNAHTIKGYMESIIQAANALKGQAENQSDLEQLGTIEESLADLVPVVILRCSAIRVKYRKVGAGGDSPWVVESVTVASSKSSDRTLSRAAWRTMLSSELLRDIDMSTIQSVEQWSNTPGMGIYGIDLSKYDTRRAPEGRPVLPPKWKKFLDGKFSNQRMDELRLAYFITSVLKDNNLGRQSLYLCGKGKEGKGVLTRAIEQIVTDAAATINESNLNPDNRFGLQGVVNKRLLLLQDIDKPTAIFESPLFKSITGNDVICIDQKFKRSIEWRVHGTKLIIVTNKPVWINGNYSLTRILPIFCQINYRVAEENDPMSILCALHEEQDKFVQWCFDTVNYYLCLRRANGAECMIYRGNRLLLMSDAQFDDYINLRNGFDGAETDDFLMAVQKDAVIEENSEFFNVKIYEEMGEDDEDYFRQLIETYFNVGPDYNMKRSELPQFFVMHTMRDSGETETKRSASLFEMLGFTRGNAKTLSRDRRFKAFVEFIKTEYNVTCQKRSGIYIYIGIALKSQHEVFSAPIMCSSLEDTNTEIPF